MGAGAETMVESKSSRAMHPFYLIRNVARRNKVLSNLSPAVRVSPEGTSWSADEACIPPGHRAGGAI